MLAAAKASVARCRPKQKSSFSLHIRRTNTTTTTAATASTTSSTIILLRHGQSTWNATPTFTGWCDEDAILTQRGILEAIASGQLLKVRGLNKFDIAYTSNLQRAIETCELVLKEACDCDGDHPRIVKAWQLNERHYGALQGFRKDDPELINKYGKHQLKKWRRDYYSQPPPMDVSHKYYQLPPAPLTESLFDCKKRVVQYWKATIVPSMTANSCTLLVAHSNTIRALVSYLDNVPADRVPQLHIPNSVPCLYQIDTTTGQPIKEFEEETLSGKSSYGHWMLSGENYERLRQKIGGKSNSFLRAIFDAWDANGDGYLTKEELCDGLSEMKGNDDIAVAALAGKIWSEIHHRYDDKQQQQQHDCDYDDGTLIDLDEFNAFAASAFQKFVPDLVQ